MSQLQASAVELLVSYFIRIHILSKYSSMTIPSDIQQLIQQFAEKCMGSKIITDDEEHRFIQLLLSKKPSLFNEKEFQLLYRASENDYSARKFHNLCDNKGATLVIVQSEFGNIFGGYTSIPWKTTKRDGEITFAKDETAFLFIIRNDDKPEEEPQIFDILEKKKMNAILYTNDCGPVFGNGYSLKITDKCNKPYDNDNCMLSSYTCRGAYDCDGDICGKQAPIRMNGYFFSVVEYEVFQIVNLS